MDIRRKDVIVSVIERNESITKTNLAKSVKKDMSMKTAFHLIEELVSEEKIIERKRGKKKRYYPVVDDPAKMVSEIDGFIKNLSEIKEECSNYQFELFDPIYRKIIRQKDDLLHDIKLWQRDLDYDAYVEDIMWRYNDSESIIDKSLRFIDFNRNRKLNNCLGSIHSYLYAAASRYVTCKSERAKYGKCKKRDSLSEEISHLETIIEDLLGYTRGIRDTIEVLERPKYHEWVFSPPLVSDLEYAQKEMKNLQDRVKCMIDKVVERRAVHKEGEKLEIGLEKIKDILRNIAEEFVVAKEEFDKAYMANLISKTEQKLHMQIKEINGYIASLPPLDTIK